MPVARRRRVYSTLEFDVAHELRLISERRRVPITQIIAETINRMVNAESGVVDASAARGPGHGS